MLCVGESSMQPETLSDRTAASAPLQILRRTICIVLHLGVGGDGLGLGEAEHGRVKVLHARQPGGVAGVHLARRVVRRVQLLDVPPFQWRL